MSVADKLDRVLTRVEELKHLLSTADGGQFGALSKELAELEPVAEKVQTLRAAERARDEAEAMLGDPEPELRELAEAEYFQQRDLVPALERELRLMLLPRDAADERSAILEVRPAAGGDEAALFAAELFRQAAMAQNIAPIYIVPPNVDDDDLRAIASYGRGYTYLLSRAGVTGAENKAAMPTSELIARIRAYNPAPPLLGFGISAPEQVNDAIKNGAAGAISGSAIVKLIEQHQHEPELLLTKLRDFVSKMKAAT